MRRPAGFLAAFAAVALIPCAALAAPPVNMASTPLPLTYADLADLADSAPLVVRAQIRKLVRVEPARAASVGAGWARFYIEARTVSLLAGGTEIGASLRYLANLPLDSRGKPPPLMKWQVLLFARPVPGQPGELQLVKTDAQLIWNAQLEARLRTILTDLVAADAPAGITGVREAIHVPGTLAGEGETQIFLSTRNGSAASVSVTRQPGMAPSWGVSFSEVTEGGKQPVRETLPWYRLACSLPRDLPHGVNLSEGVQARAQAQADYQLVVSELGECPRTRR